MLAVILEQPRDDAACAHVLAFDCGCVYTRSKRKSRSSSSAVRTSGRHQHLGLSAACGDDVADGAIDSLGPTPA